LRHRPLNPSANPFAIQAKLGCNSG
jgi:hypothetical protein